MKNTKKHGALFVGGDARSIFAAEKLSALGITPAFGATDEKRARMILEKAVSSKIEVKELFTSLSRLTANDAVILPLPASRDGVNITDSLFDEKVPLSALFPALRPGTRVFCGMACTPVSNAARDARAKLFDYYADESFLAANAALTAEGAIAEIIRLCPAAILGSVAVIFGYGRCGSQLARRLISLGARVSVIARNRQKRSLAKTDGAAAFSPEDAYEACEKADFAVNTVPAPVIGAREAAALGGRGAFVLDLADRSGAAEEAAGLVRVIRAPGLPGRFSPASAGELIARSVAAAMSP